MALANVGAMRGLSFLVLVVVGCGGSDRPSPYADVDDDEEVLAPRGDLKWECATQDARETCKVPMPLTPDELAEPRWWCGEESDSRDHVLYCYSDSSSHPDAGSGEGTWSCDPRGDDVFCRTPFEPVGVPTHGDDWGCYPDGAEWTCMRNVARWECYTGRAHHVRCMDLRVGDDLADGEVECLRGTDRGVCCGAPLREDLDRDDAECFDYEGLRCCTDGWACAVTDEGLVCDEVGGA